MHHKCCANIYRDIGLSVVPNAAVCAASTKKWSCVPIFEYAQKQTIFFISHVRRGKTNVSQYQEKNLRYHVARARTNYNSYRNCIISIDYTQWCGIYIRARCPVNRRAGNLISDKVLQLFRDCVNAHVHECSRSEFLIVARKAITICFESGMSVKARNRIMIVAYSRRARTMFI